MIESVLEIWALQMGAQAFPRRLDIFKAMAEKLTQEEGGNSLSPTWLQGFLSQYTALSACRASTIRLQRAYAGSMEGYVWWLGDVLIQYKVKEENM